MHNLPPDQHPHEWELCYSYEPILTHHHPSPQFSLGLHLGDVHSATGQMCNTVRLSLKYQHSTLPFPECHGVRIRTCHLLVEAQIGFSHLVIYICFLHVFLWLDGPFIFVTE